MSSLDQYVLKPASDSAIAIAITTAAIGNGEVVAVGPVNLAAPLALGAAVYVSNIATGVVANQLKKSQSGSTVDIESGILAPVVGGLFTLAAARVLSGSFADTTSMVKIFGVGAVSTIAGPYLHNAVAPTILNNV
jgi:hypothetical protein